jgi:FtsZ-binding cell division protein ZapB
MTAELPPSRLPASQLPENLPDRRTAERLLDILDQLERSLRQPQNAAKQSTATPADVQKLQTENATLKARQAAAKVKLEVLLARIEAMNKADDTAQESAAA